MRYIAKITFIALLLGSVAYAQQAAETSSGAQPPTCTVEGVVMDANYAVIVGVELELAGPTRYTARSDEKGHFEFKNVVDGEYELRPIRKADFTAWKKAYKMRKLRLVPSQGQREQHIDLVLLPKHDVVIE